MLVGEEPSRTAFFFHCAMNLRGKDVGKDVGAILKKMMK